MILIIGYGNSLRQDDGGGLLLAQKIEQTCLTLNLPAKRICTHQLVPELALDIADNNVNAVIFADTRTVSPFDAPSEVEFEHLSTDNWSPSVGHHLLPEVLLIYASRLYGKQPAAWLATVPGVQFDHGETLSAVTSHALSTAADRILAVLTTQIAVAAISP